MTLDRKSFLRLTGLSLLARKLFGSASPERYAMVIDGQKCLKKEGCTKCIEACHKAHNVPAIPDPRRAVKWIWKEPFRHAFPGQESAFFKEQPFLVFCNQCDNPPCVRVCPTRATWKREDGIVAMDWHRCIGCRYCIAACPYGSRSFNWGDPRRHLAVINPDFPTRAKGVVEKCNFCEERLRANRPPACVEACPEKAMQCDRLSKLTHLLQSRHTVRRKPELGTEPEVYYIL